jgi:hypothetical protein
MFYLHLVQAFASKHSLRRDLSTAMIYNPKDRSIPLPSLRRGGRRHRVSTSARRLRASCGRITELMEGAVAARAVQAEALRRIRGGLPQQDENSSTEPRPKRPRGSGQTATRGASPRSTARNAQHQWLTETHIRLAVGSLPIHRTSRCSTLRPSRSRWGLCFTKRRSFRRD